MKYITLITAILLIGIVSASSYDVFAGDSISFDLGQEYEYYSVIGNSTELDFNISQNGTVVTLSFGKYAQSDYFNIIFFDSEKQVIHEYGGGCRKCKIKEPEDNCTIIIQDLGPKTPGQINLTEDNPEDEEENKSDPRIYGFLLMGVAFFIGLIVWLNILLKKKKFKKRINKIKQNLRRFFLSKQSH